MHSVYAQISFLVGLDVIGEIRTLFAAEVRLYYNASLPLTLRSKKKGTKYLASVKVQKRVKDSHGTFG